MRNGLKGLVVTVVALTTIGAAIPASAKAPLKENFVDQGIFTLPDILCGSFTLTEVMDSESVQVTTFFDGTGDPVKVATRANSSERSRTPRPTRPSAITPRSRRPRRSPPGRPPSTVSATTTSSAVTARSTPRSGTRSRSRKAAK
jgi:hypothetical protein